jgi:hypothetical protein
LLNSAEEVWIADPALTAQAVGVTDLRQGMIGKRYTQSNYLTFSLVQQKIPERGCRNRFFACFLPVRTYVFI